MSSEGTEGASPQCGQNPAFGQRDSGYLAGTPAARWSGTEPAISRRHGRVEAVVKPVEEGAYVYQHLNRCSCWEGPRKKGQGFKPDLGNLAVRHYRGAAGNVSHGGTVNPSCNRKSRNGNPPTYSGARPCSIPTAQARICEGLCQEGAKAPCCTKDEGGPFGVAL